MNDFDLAVSKVGNRYDLVLIASQRVREINRQRRKQWENSKTVKRTSLNYKSSSEQAVSDVEEGRVGREYLLRGGGRQTKSRKEKFDDI